MFPRLRIAALPCFETRLARTRHDVESPGALARRGVVRINESSRAVLAASGAEDHFVLHNNGRDRGAVALSIVGHRRVPENRPGSHAECDDVRVECGFEQPIAEHRKATIDAAAAEDDVRQRALVAPDLPAGARVNGPGRVVGSGHVDDAVIDKRRSRQAALRIPLKDPLDSETTDVVRRNLRQRTVALTGVVAGERHPFGRVFVTGAQILWRYLGTQPRRQHDDQRHRRHTCDRRPHPHRGSSAWPAPAPRAVAPRNVPRYRSTSSSARSLRRSAP